MNYQTHQGVRGTSDSPHKLTRLSLPKDLSGKAVLDIGCNEGFFCDAAARRGARRVVGIDYSGPSIDFARRSYTHPAIEYRCQRWDHLPDERFDLVLWTSAMHYERDPKAIMRMVADRLAPDGLFVLECGVARGLTKEMVLVLRHGDSLWYPTQPLLLDFMQERFSVRQVGQPETTEGDPVPRSVFHAKKNKPTVFLLRGPSLHGKSATATRLVSAASKVVSLDLFLYRIKDSSHHHTDIQRFIRDEHDPEDLSKVYLGIDRAGLTQRYADLLAEGVSDTDAIVVIEGMLTDAQVKAMAIALGGRAYLWDAERVFTEGMLAADSLPA